VVDYYLAKGGLRFVLFVAWEEQEKTNTVVRHILLRMTICLSPDENNCERVGLKDKIGCLLIGL
jgi:hypothetical protein